MAGMENLNSAESREMSAEMMNENEAADRVARESNDNVARGVRASVETVDVDENINGAMKLLEISCINQDRLNKLLKGITPQQNVLDKNTTISKISYEDAGKLLAFAKANRNTTDGQQYIASCNILYKYKIKEQLMKDALKGSNISIENMQKQSPARKSELAWRLAAVDEGTNSTNVWDKSMKYYEKMFKSGERIPPRPRVYNMATGDGSGTKGILGIPNLGTASYEYSNREKNSSTNFLCIEDPRKNAYIQISSNGFDGTGGGCEFDFNGQILCLEDTGNGLSINKDKTTIPSTELGKWRDSTNNRVVIPGNYQDQPLSVTSYSNPLGKKYDEMFFSFSCQNIHMSHDRIIKGKETGANFETGKYELTDSQRNRIRSDLSTLVDYSERSETRNVPVDWMVTVDKLSVSDDLAKKYQDKMQETLDSTAVKNNGLGNMLNRYHKIIMESMKNQVFDKDPEKNMKQQENQGYLACCRFDESFLLGGQKFFNLLKRRNPAGEKVDPKIIINPKVSLVEKGQEKPITIKTEPDAFSWVRSE